MGEGVADILATISSKGLLGFPFKSLTELPCWLSLIPVTTEPDKGLFLDSFSSSIQGIDFHVNCTTCSDYQFSRSLNAMLDVLEEDEISQILINRMNDLINEVMMN